ncbi:unnamed protein product [Adineta ricciae]|uniref:G-protein coupled receptors family 1 profile domain-containing protein n=1 Tax=Adineta ricciae TaxID=249248 RepID=A0A815AR16_ADIRI|nr:unnamed protein product [Adineta ricciae]CAF1260407.1 unnamed protein product [Adineta ricciae]
MVRSVTEIDGWIENWVLYVINIILCIGIVGNFLNIIVFAKLKLFRGNRSAFYLTAESVVNIYLLFDTVLPMLFQTIYHVYPENVSLLWCKLKTTLNQSARLLIGSIVCFEALDQYFSTHHRSHLRQLITLKLARFLVIFSATLWTIQTIPYIIFFDIVPSFGCIITNQSLVYYYSYVYYIFLNGLLPICIASVFSLLAYRNVRHIIRRQLPIERRRLDRQMTAMIFARVIMFVVVSLPYTIFRVYILNLNGLVIDSAHIAVNQLALTMATTLLLGNYSVKLL